jgi:magnesium-transporting ATPase (P-type)
MVISGDKTGTLTQNHMIVQRPYLGGILDWPVGLGQRPDLVDLYALFFLAARMCPYGAPGSVLPIAYVELQPER